MLYLHICLYYLDIYIYVYIQYVYIYICIYLYGWNYIRLHGIDLYCRALEYDTRNAFDIQTVHPHATIH